MNRELARKVADAVLYEGYMLYPYRPSAIKNRQRWSFGILYPPAYEEVRSRTERSTLRSECLLETTGHAKIHIELRFLHLIARQVAQLRGERLQPVSSVVIDGRLIESWEEGRERSVEVEFDLANELPEPAQFSFPASCQSEALRDSAGQALGEITRTQQEVQGTISVRPQKLGGGVMKLTVEVRNTTSLPQNGLERNSALLRSLLSAHTILTASGGGFVSLLDPPDSLRAAVNACQNIGNFPVLVGETGTRDTLLCSPIVLYDYPQIAPESAGDFYDATEIDEMLTLRIMTLTEQEKSEMALGDEHARDLLQRTEQGAREQLMRMHGAIRGLRPASEKP